MHAGGDKRHKAVLEGAGNKPRDAAHNFKSHFIKQIKIFTDLVCSHRKSLERVLKMNGKSAFCGYFKLHIKTDKYAPRACLCYNNKVKNRHKL